MAFFTHNSFKNHDISYSQATSPVPVEGYSFCQMHAHEMNEIYYLLSGEGRYIVEGVEYPLSPGLLLIMRSNEAHMPQIECSHDYARVALHFRASFADRLDPEHRLLAPFYNRSLGCLNRYDNRLLHPEIVQNCFSKMAEAQGDYYKKELQISICLFTLLEEIVQTFSQISAEGYEARNGVIHELIYYIDRHLGDELSLTVLQDRFFISKSQLTRLFKQATGSTVWEYIIVKRLNLARNMLRDGARAQQAAHLCGFSDYSAFFKAYRQKYGVTPGQDKMNNAV